jgi:hypothetical protein
MNIDFKKYKRFFAFGCSFTGYIWPTWADVLSKEMPECEFYNMGHAGAGNLFITARITEAHARFKFNQDDLVVVMWTTFCREDRYFNDNWNCPGNIFTQNLYDEKFVKKFADTKGYLIRDLALITSASSFLESLPCNSIKLSSVPYNYQNEETTYVDKILNLYSDTVKITPKSLFELEMNGIWDNGHTYTHTNLGKNFGDYHPNPLRYYNYLNKLNFPLTDLSLNFAKESLEKLQQAKHELSILKTFPNNSQGRQQFKEWL